MNSFYRNRGKAIFDFVVAAIALIVLSPLCAIVAVAIKLESKGPVIYRQERLGYKGLVYVIYKFRSMCIGAEKQGTGVYSMDGDARVTKVGRIIRATSIDEVPQLVNVLKGDMALVGPRPALTYHPWPFEQYSQTQKRLFDVRPGITGWAQVNGRKVVEWKKRIELNIWYVDHLTLFLDIKILLLTVMRVLFNTGNVNVGKTAEEADEVKSNDLCAAFDHIAVSSSSAQGDDRC